MKLNRFLKQNYGRLLWVFKNYKKLTFDAEIYSVSKGHLHGKTTYKADGIVTSSNCDFINEPRFAEAYAMAKNTNPWPGFTLQWRVYSVCWFANHVKNLEGDFVECGVNTGAYSIAVINYIDFQKSGKQFWLLDTFEGLVEELISEEEKKAGIGAYLGSYKNVYDQVKETFAPYNVKIIKGAVPKTLPECKAQKICYLSIDMNCVQPEIEAIHYFWDKVVRGGVIILDDYGFPMHIHQKKAFDNFAKEKKVEILSLPTGQGILFKP